MEAKKILTEFLQAWVDQDYKLMYKLSQKTWADKNPVKQLEWLFRDSILKDFNIFSTSYVSGSSMKYGVDLTLNDDTKLMSLINVICEAAPLKPAPWGEWGVNPSSVLNIVQKVTPKAASKEVKGKSNAKK